MRQGRLGFGPRDPVCARGYRGCVSRDSTWWAMRRRGGWGFAMARTEAPATVACDAEAEGRAVLWTRQARSRSEMFCASLGLTSPSLEEVGEESGHGWCGIQLNNHRAGGEGRGQALRRVQLADCMWCGVELDASARKRAFLGAQGSSMDSMRRQTRLGVRGGCNRLSLGVEVHTCTNILVPG